MAAKTDMDRLGVFKELGYTTIGDKYKPQINKPFNVSAGKGRQMLIGGTKAKCGNQVGYFDNKFMRVLEGEAYTDIVQIRRKDRIQAAKRNIGKAWVPSNDSKLPSGLGSFHGCFNGRIDAFSAVTKPKEKYKTPGKNFYTNPGKRGTGYGYLNITIGNYHKYASEPYDRSKEMRQKEASMEIKNRKGGVFKLSAYGKEFFDDNPFHSKKPLPTKKESSRPAKMKLKPFVQSSPAKLSGGCMAGTFTRYPEHSVDPYISMSKIMQDKKPKRKFVGGIFKPSPCPKSMPMNSVVTQNVHRSMNSSNFLAATT